MQTDIVFLIFSKLKTKFHVNSFVLLQYYGKLSKCLEFEHKMIACDMHRTRWEVGDWTDDTDQMILIILSILEKNGQVCICYICN